MGILPTVDEALTWRDVHAKDMDAWAPALAVLCREWRLPDGEWERFPFGEDSLVFSRGGVVVKLVPPFLTEDATRELEVLPRLDLPVPSPRVDDVRTIDGWTAIRMTRLDGVCAAQVWSGLAWTDQSRIMTRIGELLRAIWKTPATDVDPDPLPAMAALRSEAERHEAAGFEGIQTFLDRALPVLLPDLRFVHLDLTVENIMLREQEGRWELSGVLDFVASRTTFPPLDLVAPGVLFCRGAPMLVRAMLRGAGLDGFAADELVAWYLLHPFAEIHRDPARAGQAMDGSLEHRLRQLWRH